MRRLAIAVAALLCLAAGLTGAVSPVDAAVSGDDFQGEDFPVTLRWVPCYTELGSTFECATARVPLDYDRLDAGRIPIDLVRLPATGDPVGSLFLNPGGPGGSGVDFVVGAGPILFPEVREQYDLIGFDPRGIMRSNPLLCFGTFDASIRNSWPIPFPISDFEEELYRDSDNYLRTQCENRGGIIQNKMSTANVARDLEVLRAAVGDELLNYAGYSYGTIIGQVYAGLFPDKVGHVIIDGVLDIRNWVGDPDGRSDTVLEERLGSSLGAEDTLDEFFRLCEAAGPSTCAIAPDAEARTEAILAQLRDEPLVFTDPSTGDVVFVYLYQYLISDMLGAMYSPADWEFLSFILADLELLLGGGGPATAEAEFAADVTALQESLGLRPLPKYPNFIEGFPGVACVDTSNPGAFRAWAEAADEAAVAAPHFGEPWTWITSVCKGWPGQDQDRFTGPYGPDTANPVLVMSTRYDPATSWEQAVSANDLLPNSALVTVEGWGHTTLFTSTCADAIVTAYLLDDELPTDGTTCPADIGVPFADPFAPAATGDVEDPAVDARRALLRQTTIAFRS